MCFLNSKWISLSSLFLCSFFFACSAHFLCPFDVFSTDTSEFKVSRSCTSSHPTKATTMAEIRRHITFFSSSRRLSAADEMKMKMIKIRNEIWQRKNFSFRVLCCALAALLFCRCWWASRRNPRDGWGRKGRKVDDDDECALSRSCVWVSSSVAAAAAAQNSRRALSTAETFAAPFGWYFNWKIIENVQHFSTRRNFYMNNHGMETAEKTRDLVYPWQHVMCTISSEEGERKVRRKLSRSLADWRIEFLGVEEKVTEQQSEISLHCC